MSKFIENTLQIQPRPLISSSVTQVTSPKVKTVLGGEFNKQMQYSCKQEDELVRMCRKLTIRQLQQVHLCSTKDVEIGFDKLKRKMKNRGNFFKNNSPSLALQSQAAKYIDHQQYQRPLGVISRKNCSQINIYQKYNSKIVQKMQVLKEVRQIENDKNFYHRWLDQTRNSPIASPNYNKMTYVFEKLRKIGIQAQVGFKDVLQNSLPHKDTQYMKIRCRQSSYHNHSMEGSNSYFINVHADRKSYRKRIKKGWNPTNLKHYISSAL